MSSAETELVRRARRGDTAAFGELVQAHSAKLFQVAYRLLGDEASADDAVQEAFIKAFRKLDRFDGKSAFGTWMYRITVNCSMDEIRRTGRRRESGDLDGVLSTGHAPTDEPDPHRIALSAEIQQRVDEVLDDLSTMERTAFVLKHCEGRSLREISEVMDVRVNSVKHAIFRAVRKLRAELEPLVRGNYETA